MYILAIETTGAEGSVALLQTVHDEAVNVEKGDESEKKQYRERITERKIKGQMSHLRELIPSIEAVLLLSGTSKEEITHIAVSVGPGSFTGIRIGVSTARALSQAMGLETAISVPTLQGFLYKEEAERAKAEGKVCCAVINARRGQVYGMIDGYLADGPYMMAEVLELIKDKLFADGKQVIFFGDGVDAYEDMIHEALDGFGEYELADKEYRYQEAYAVARYAAANAQVQSVGLAELLPDYMRKAEAEQKLEAGQLPICRGPKQE